MQVKCPHCGFSRDVPEEKIPPQATVATCPRCSQKFSFRQEQEEKQAEEHQQSTAANGDYQESTQEKSRNNNDDIWSRLEAMQDTESESNGRAETKAMDFGYVPWENLQEHGFFPGLSMTIKMVLFAPGRFFSALPLGFGFTLPLIFYLIISQVQILSMFFWRMAGFLPQLENEAAGVFGLTMTGFGAFFLLVIYPLLMAGYIFFYSAISHLCLLAVKSGQRGYEGTFKVIAYANAPMIIGIVPVFGPWIGFFWSLVCTFLGFKLVHSSPGPRVLLAMAIPYLFLLLLSAALLGLGGGGGY